MSIYVTGDTHGGIDVRKLQSKRFIEGKKLLTKSDYLIIAGDFGVWKNKKASDFLEWISNKNWTTLFVEGNHEDYDYLKTFPLVDMFGNKVRKINDSVFQLLRGEVYIIEGYKVFAFGGARSIDKITAQRQEGVDWFKEEESSYQEEVNAINNLNRHDNRVDIIISHTCASSTLDELSKLYGFYIDDYDNQNKFFEHLKSVINYDIWFFGHMHIDLQINEKEVAVYNRVLGISNFLEKD